MTAAVKENERPGGSTFLPARIAEPARTEIEDEIWSWIVLGRDDAADFVDYLEEDEERHGRPAGLIAKAG